MIEVFDDRGKRFSFQAEPARIVSLVPSDTYTLAELGGADRLVGRSRYCLAPSSVQSVRVLGGTKNADTEAIVALRPDLVVANQEESRRVDVERLERAGLPVFVSFPKTVAEGLEHAERLARLFPSRAKSSGERLSEMRAELESLAQSQKAPVATFVPIWKAPLMTVHGATFISDALELAGGRNVFSERQRRYPLAADLGQRPAVERPGRDVRYPRITLEEVRARRPSLVLLPDEPYAFDEDDAEAFRGLPGAPEVRFCEGKDLMWYGLRALEGLPRIASLCDQVRDSLEKRQGCTTDPP